MMAGMSFEMLGPTIDMIWVGTLGGAAIAGVPFWTDAALLHGAGIPAVLFGPSGAGAHADEEWVDLPSVEACANIYLQTAMELSVSPGNMPNR